MYIQSNKVSPISHKGVFPTKKINRYTISTISDELQISTKTLRKEIGDISSKQGNFLKLLAERYNEIYYYAKEKENPQVLFDIAKYVTKPKDAHKAVIEKYSGSFDILNEIFQSVKGDKDMDFVESFPKKVFHGNKFDAKIILDILNSPYKDEYIKNINKYKEYLRYNAKNPEAIKELDTMVAENKFDAASYEMEQKIANLKRKILSYEDLQKYYSKNGIKIIKYISEYLSKVKTITDSDYAEILEMYKTTNKENKDIRKKLIGTYMDKSSVNKEDANLELGSMRSVFEKIDSNEYIRKFIEKFLNTDTNIESFAELNKILETIPPVKAYIFNKNLTKIVANTLPGEKRHKILQNKIANPSYIEYLRLHGHDEALKYGYIKRNSGFKNMMNSIENGYNRFKYFILKLRSNDEICRPSEKNLLVDEITGESLIPPVKIAHNELPTIEDFKKGMEEVQTPVKNEIVDSVNFVKKPMKQSKIELRENVIKLIKEKLHAKTVEKQEGLYSENATKMRLKLLPEIFASIKETRAIDRAVGKKKSYSANKDAVDLYSRINGQNRKLVRYMLMKRNVDGTRMFEVKDIITFIDKANSQVKKAKEKNPSLKSKDVKAYFDHLHQAKIDQYGKLTRPKKATKK